MWENIVEQDSENVGPGRKSRRLVFNPRAYCALALEFEGSFVEVGLIDLAGKLITHESHPFSNFTSAEEQCKLSNKVTRMIDNAASPVLGVGVGFPASVNPVTKAIVSFNIENIRHPISFNTLFAPFLKTVNAEVFVENDVNLACKGEMFLWCPDSPNADLCYFTLGTGFGAGIMLNGQLWQGSNYLAGEIGNTIVHTVDLAMPFAGQLNTLESYINISAINKAFGLRIQEKPPISDALRRDIVEFILPHMATSIYNFIFLFDVRQFVLSGFIPNYLGPLLYTRLEETLQEMLRGRERDISIRKPQVPYSTLVGAASVVFDKTILNEMHG